MEHGSVPETADLRDQIVAILPRLRRFCMALARGQDAGDDLCQAAVERALSRSEQFVQGTRLDSWMYRIAQNIHIDQGRRKQTRGAEIDVDDMAGSLSGDDGVQIVEGRSELSRAHEAIAALPEEQRVLMALVVLDGMSYKEAAATLDIPVGTVMSRIARARQAIDNHLNAGEQP
ncbi:MAG: RNA polymerase sigma factor [Novosphingobium sp.]|nr:RNA polymerase sigma factor [Novosphingobium sp.]